MQLRESAENYLETILKLSLEKGQVRSIDIAEDLNYSKPSVSVAMKNLRENGLAKVDENGYITLTKSGRFIAESVYERHLVLTEFLKGLGVSEEVAAEEACRMEHDISEDTFNKLKKFLWDNELLREESCGTCIYRFLCTTRRRETA